MRVTYHELHVVLTRALERAGLEPDRASRSARLIADASRDGVASHGLNLVPRLLRMIGGGIVDVHARATRVSAHGVVERWDGGRGVGNLNAHDAMTAAIAQSRTDGIGCVALANTNHWMRGGAYGWQAADAGVIGICWTNTLPNLPPWGADAPRIGNNPLVIAVPRPGGHVVLDMAMSQFSYGALATHRARGELLPVAGGFDESGALTRDPAAIEASRRPLPIGFWKGSGLSVMLDLIAATLSGGRSTHEIPADPEHETGISQVFLALDVSSLSAPGETARIVDAVIDDLHVRYPGERAVDARARNMAEGIPVDPAIWQDVLRYLAEP